MFRHSDDTRHPHPSDRLDTLNDALIALSAASGAFALFGVLLLAGWL